MKLWHGYGRLNDEGRLTVIIGPTEREPADTLDLPGFDELAYLRSFDHKPTDADRDELEAIMKAHA